MRKLASLVTLMNDPKSVQPTSPDDEDIGVKGAGFAHFASPKKRNGGASVGNDGFAKIAKKKKRSANVGKEDGSAPNSQIYAKQVFDRASNQENTSANSGQRVSTKLGKRLFSQSGKRVLTQPGLAPPQCAPTQVAQCAPTQSAQPIPTQSAQTVPTKSAQLVPTQSTQPIPTPSRQIVQPHSERGARHGTGECFPDSPAQSGQSTPNQSRQPSAQSRQHTPEHAPTPTHPSTVIMSSTTANNVRWNIGSENRDGRMRVEVIDGTLEPSYYCSAKNREIMYEQLEPTGYNWKTISKETRNFYFEEFKKYFVWRQADAIIYKGWLGNARRKYSELVSGARSIWENHKKQDNRIGMNVYLSWVEFWKSSKFQEKSSIQKSNRRSGVDGHPSTHTSGSASHKTVAARWKVQYKCDPTADQLFKQTHTRHVKKKKIVAGEDNEIGMDDEDDSNSEDEVIWIDKKSQKIYETFEKLVEQLEKTGQPVDRNEVFLQAVGGHDKKNRVYGVGSSQGLFYRSKTMACTSSFVAEENQQLKDELIEVKDRMKALENQLAMLIEANSVQVPRRLQSPTDFDGQNDDN